MKPPPSSWSGTISTEVETEDGEPYYLRTVFDGYETEFADTGGDGDISKETGRLYRMHKEFVAKALADGCHDGVKIRRRGTL